MAKLHSEGFILKNGAPVCAPGNADKNALRRKTIAYSILESHNKSDSDNLFRIKFDSLISHDITYVGIIQTAKASGLEKFPVPYVMTNCHNSLCAVGGTINEDDHVFGLSAAKKYGGIYVPANLAVIHQYAREMLSGCGRMILGSDSHTRYGAMGTMGVGEGGPEIVKQLLSNTYDITPPEVVLVYLTGTPRKGVGPQDIAIELCGAVYKNGFVKNKVLEFAGPGVKNLPMDFRIGIDVMTTETACLSSVWITDEKVEEYLAAHGRQDAYKKLDTTDGAYYDRLIEIDLSQSEPMAALPFHPSEACTIRELIANASDIFRDAEKRALNQFGGKAALDLVSKIKDGKIITDQGVIAGCSGGMYDNIAEAAAILKGGDTGCGYFSLSVYPPSMPVNLELIKNGIQQQLMEAGAVFKPCFCGPCFGAGDVPANNALSIRHTTRNFPNREGSKPGDGQLSAVMLMDARSIAATARNHGVLTPADEIDYTPAPAHAYSFDKTVYEKRVYKGFGKADESAELRFGPNITEWPKIPSLSDDILLRLDCVIHDPVTTTDELIPSGETSSYRSNPIKLASFALSRRDPKYTLRAAETKAMEVARKDGKLDGKLKEKLDRYGISLDNASIASVIFANKPGDGSAREQAASCQRVLGGGANICYEFATKRYRSNCINWGMLPFTIDADTEFNYECGDLIFVKGVRDAIINKKTDFAATVITDNGTKDITLHIANLTDEEREIILCGCLMNYYASRKKEM